MNPIKGLMVAVLAALMLTSRMATAAQEYTLSATRSHAIGSSSGMLRITALGIEYDTATKRDARRWNYLDIQHLEIHSPTRMSVLTYEDRGWTKLGADRRFDFEVRGGTISAEVVAFILAHTERAVMTSVLPPATGEAMYRLLVKHERHGRGSDGVLLMYKDALVFGTEREGETRYWRFADIFAVLPVDRDRLEVLAYEGGAGELRPFIFQLKSAMPEAFARDLWSRVNPPAPVVRRAAE